MGLISSREDLNRKKKKKKRPLLTSFSPEEEGIWQQTALDLSCNIHSFLGLQLAGLSCRLTSLHTHINQFLKINLFIFLSVSFSIHSSICLHIFNCFFFSGESWLIHHLFINHFWNRKFYLNMHLDWKEFLPSPYCT